MFYNFYIVLHSNVESYFVRRETKYFSGGDGGGDGGASEPEAEDFQGLSVLNVKKLYKCTFEDA